MSARPRESAMLCAAVLISATLAGCNGSGASSHSVETKPKAALEPLRVVATIRLPGEPSELAVAGGKLWVSFRDRGSVAAVDPRTNRIGRPIQLGNGTATSFDNLLVGDKRALWAIDRATARLYRVDTRTQEVRPALSVEGPIEMTRAFGSLWIAQFYPYKVSRVDPETGRIVARISASGPTDVDAGAGSIWILAHHRDQVLRVDPATNRVTATIPLISLGSTPERMAFGEGALWVSDPQGQSITRVDATSNKATVEVVMRRAQATWPVPVSTGGGYVWVGGEWELFRLDPRTNQVTAAVRLARVVAGEEGSLGDVRYAFGSVWIVDVKDRKLFRVVPGRRNAQ